MNRQRIKYLGVALAISVMVMNTLSASQPANAGYPLTFHPTVQEEGRSHGGFYVHAGPGTFTVELTRNGQWYTITVKKLQDLEWWCRYSWPGAITGVNVKFRPVVVLDSGTELYSDWSQTFTMWSGYQATPSTLGPRWFTVTGNNLAQHTWNGAANYAVHAYIEICITAYYFYLVIPYLLTLWPESTTFKEWWW